MLKLEKACLHPLLRTDPTKQKLLKKVQQALTKTQEQLFQINLSAKNSIKEMKIWLDTSYLSTSIDNLISDIKDALLN